MQKRKFILSGGGTGGHIFPAVSVARELQRQFPGCEILFIGALGRMEMEKIPKEGFQIIGLPVAGLKRSLSLQNFKILWNMARSYFKAKKLIKTFKPDCVIGTGGYASLAVLYAAAKLNCPTVIWEGNGFAGLTNKILSKKVKVICTGMPGMENFFPAEKIVFTGNPVRAEMLHLITREEARKKFGLDPAKPLVFATGGSLGARTLNLSLEQKRDELLDAGIQLIWQTGKNFNKESNLQRGLYAGAFIENMADAYAAADLVISRAGALSIAEICVTQKPAILIPSPNVTDDHQTQNALVLSKREAAVLLKDSEALQQLVPLAISLIGNQPQREKMSAELQQLARPHATLLIVEEIKKLLVA